MTVFEFRFQPRRATAAEAAANNNVLLMGEEGFETDTGRRKTGDGETRWNDLPYDDDILKTAIGAYSKPGGGIPKTDMAAAVQTSLGKADSAYQAPAVVAAGADQAAARTAIGAGTASTKSDVGLGSADNTSDANKPVSTAQQAALDGKAALSRSAVRLPLNTKLRGGNITVKPTTGAWRRLFAEWDWANWIKPQIDRAAVLGLNAIRLIGGPQVVLRAASGGIGQISQANYVAQWAQVAAYCQSLNMLLYPCLVEQSDYDQLGVGYTDAGLNAVVVASAQTLAAYSNVIAFDVFQEGGTGITVSDVTTLMASIRAVAPGIPLTCSDSSGNYGSVQGFWTDKASLQYQLLTAAGGSDFADYHIYLDSVVPSDADFHLSHGKPVIFGEFGDTQDHTTSAQAARYTAMATLHNRPGVLGSFLWALADQDTVTSNQSGVWDNTGYGPPLPAASTTPLSVTSGKRTNMTNVLPTFNRTELPTTPYQAPNLLSAAQANPTATTGGWATGSNTYLSATPEGLAVAATAAGNVIAGTTPTNGTPVLPSTPYIATVKVLAASSYSSKPVSLQIDWYDSVNAYITSSPLTNAIDSTTSPLPISVVRISPSNAAFAVLTFKGYGFVANENHLLINCSLRQYNAGEVTASSYPVAALSSGEGQLFGAPSGALWTSLDRTQNVISASLGFAASGTPRAILGGFPKPTLVTGLKFLTGSTAAVTPTHWWVVATDAAGNVLAVSADQTTTAIPASTVITVPFTVPTVLAGNVYFHLMIAATTMPTLAGITGLLNSPTIAPVFSGASTATGQTTPPAIGGTLAAPTAQSATNYWYWAY